MSTLYVDRRGVTLKADGEALIFYENEARIGTVPGRLTATVNCLP